MNEQRPKENDEVLEVRPVSGTRTITLTPRFDCSNDDAEVFGQICVQALRNRYPRGRWIVSIGSPLESENEIVEIDGDRKVETLKQSE